MGTFWMQNLFLWSAWPQCIFLNKGSERSRSLKYSFALQIIKNPHQSNCKFSWYVLCKLFCFSYHNIFLTRQSCLFFLDPNRYDCTLQLMKSYNVYTYLSWHNNLAIQCRLIDEKTSYRDCPVASITCIYIRTRIFKNMNATL